MRRHLAHRAGGYRHLKPPRPTPQDAAEPLQPEKVAAAIKCTGISADSVDAVLADVMW